MNEAVFSQENLIKVNGADNPQCVEYYYSQTGLYCSTTPLTTTNNLPNLRELETHHLVFDNRYWKAAWGEKTATAITIEYIPQGEDINNWHELITSQFFPGLEKKLSVQAFIEAMKANFKETGLNPVTTVDQINEDTAIFEFRVLTPPNLVQDELQLVRKEKDGIYVLHYVVKKADMGATARAEWIQLLKQAK